MADSNEECLKRMINPSLAILLSEVIDIEKNLELLGSQKNFNDQKKILLKHCNDKIKLVRISITSFGQKKVNFAWRLLHRVKEDMILLMEREELETECRRTINKINRSVMINAEKTGWTEKISIGLERLQKASQSESKGEYDHQLKKLQVICKGASAELNDLTDDQFWDIWTIRWMQIIYSFMGVVTLTLFIWKYIACPELDIYKVLLIGMLGSLASGLISGVKEFFAKGTFWIPTLYYTIGRPLVGIISAIVMLWLIMGKILISIEPMGDICIEAGKCCSEKNRTQCPLQNPDSIKSDTGKGLSENNHSNNLLMVQNNQQEKRSEKKDSVDQSSNESDTTRGNTILIYYTAPNECSAQIIIMVFLFFAGFAGDKLLKSISCKVIERMFINAEKTKDSQTA
ncbi:MAG TPA: hypothetical protein VHP36_04635 [Chitinispirillaceae bacterium]|nr:hypothetical protein [Chitinispirillaceae bacterium]